MGFRDSEWVMEGSLGAEVTVGTMAALPQPMLSVPQGQCLLLVGTEASGRAVALR